MGINHLFPCSAIIIDHNPQGHDPPSDYKLVFRCQGRTEEARSLAYGGVVGGCGNGTSLSLHRICRNNNSPSVSALTMPLDTVGCPDLDSLESAAEENCTSQNIPQSVGITTWNQSAPAPCLWEAPEADTALELDNPQLPLLALYEVTFRQVTVRRVGEEDFGDCNVTGPQTATFSCGLGGHFGHLENGIQKLECHSQSTCSFQLLDEFEPNVHAITASISCEGRNSEALDLNVAWLPSFSCNGNAQSGDSASV